MSLLEGLSRMLQNIVKKVALVVPVLVCCTVLDEISSFKKNDGSQMASYVLLELPRSLTGSDALEIEFVVGSYSQSDWLIACCART